MNSTKIRIARSVALIILAMTGAILAPTTGSYAAGDVVYDSLPGATSGSFLTLELAQALELAGNARSITQIDFLMSSSNDFEQFVVRLHTIGNDYRPQALLWESAIQTWTDNTPFSATKIASVAVPNITVPNRFAWVTERILPTQLSQNGTALTSVGTPLASFYGDPNIFVHWVSVPNVSVAVRITAVPEPTTAMLLVLASCGLCCIRRR